MTRAGTARRHLRWSSAATTPHPRSTCATRAGPPSAPGSGSRSTGLRRRAPPTNWSRSSGLARRRQEHRRNPGATAPSGTRRRRRGDRVHLAGEGRRRVSPVQLRPSRRRPPGRRRAGDAARLHGAAPPEWHAVRGSRSVVIGRSAIVGRPIALMLTNADSTVTICHSRTRDLAAVCREADILVAAIGRPGMVDASYVKPGAFVIDVGTTPRDGVVVGDVDRESVEPVAGLAHPGSRRSRADDHRDVAAQRAGAGESPPRAGKGLKPMPSLRVRWSEQEARKPYARPFMVTFTADDGTDVGSVALNGADLLYYTQFQTAVLSLAGELFVDAAVEASGDPQRAWLDRIAGLMPENRCDRHHAALDIRRQPGAGFPAGDQRRKAAALRLSMRPVSSSTRSCRRCSRTRRAASFATSRSKLSRTRRTGDAPGWGHSACSSAGRIPARR